MKLVVMASGRGSNFASIDEAIKSGELCAQIVAVISDKADAPVIGKAIDAGVPNVAILERKGFSTREDYDKELAALVAGFDPDYVVLAGFMRVLGREFVKMFKDRIVNIHPALLPSFPGLDAQKQALDYGAKVTGCTVHFVDEGTDTGPVILQKEVPILDGDDEEKLSARILEQEHRLYVEALRLLSEHRVELDGRKVRILGGCGCGSK